MECDPVVCRPERLRDIVRRIGGPFALSQAFFLAGYLLLAFLRVGGEAYFPIVSGLGTLPLSLGAVVSSWAASRSSAIDRRERRAWRLFALAYLFYTAGDLMWIANQILYETPIWPSPADLSYFAFYPLMMAALLSFSQPLATREERLTFGLDASTVMIVGAMFVWQFLLQPILLGGDSGAVAKWVSLGYPASDLVLLFGVISLFLRRARRSGRLAFFLLAGTLLFFGADVVFVFQNASGAYQSGNLASVMYAGSYFFAAMSGVYAQSRATDKLAEQRDRFTLLPYAAAALAFALLLLVPGPQQETLIYGVLALTAIVVVRQVVAAKAVLRAQKDLRDSDERFRFVAQATSDAVWDWNLLTDHVWWGDGVRALFGYQARDVVPDGAWWLGQIDPSDRGRIEHEVHEAISSGAHTISLTYRFRRADGSYAPVVDRGFIARDERGVAVRMVGSMMDISDRVRAEQAMAAARDAALESARLKSQFLANMSHEIRTPINGVIGMTDLVLGSELAPEQRWQLEMVKSSADSLLTVINDILDFSKIEAGKLALEELPFGLRDALGDTLSVLAVRARAKGLELMFRTTRDVPEMVLGDAGRLQQVITNLVGNAIKFTERGEILVTVDAERAASGKATLRVSVADTGCGIAAEKRQMIFEAFTQEDSSTTRRYGGTGLGLAISAQLVALMGGRIWVESELGRGSTFIFTADCAIDDGAALAPSAGAEMLAGLRVLIADDNQTQRQILEEVVREWDVVSTTACDGASALAEISRAETAGAPYRLVLLDAMMPEMDGFRVAAALQNQVAAVLMLSSADHFGDVARCRALGVEAYLTKPVRSRDLLKAMLRALGKIDREVAPKAAPIVRHEGLKLLLAEDNRVNQLVAREMLRRRGHSVTVVGDGQQAIAALDRELFDVVLMDVQMPQMDGFEATARIRASGARVPIVAMTAHAMKGDKERCLSAGMDGYVPKPLHAAELYAVVEGFGARAIE